MSDFSLGRMDMRSVVNVCGDDADRANAMIETHWAIMASGEVLNHSKVAGALKGADERLIAMTGVARILLDRLDCQSVLRQSEIAMELMGDRDARQE